MTLVNLHYIVAPICIFFVLVGPDNMDFRLNTVFIFNVIAWDYNKLCVDCRYTKRYYLLTCMVNKRPMGHIAYLRNQYQSIDTFAQSYDYSITFRRVATHTHVRAHRMRENPPKLSSINLIRLIHTKLELLKPSKSNQKSDWLFVLTRSHGFGSNCPFTTENGISWKLNMKFNIFRVLTTSVIHQDIIRKAFHIKLRFMLQEKKKKWIGMIV